MAGWDDTMNTNRAPSAFPRLHAFFVILACAIFGFAPGAAASPFLLDLVSSGSSGGGGGHAHISTGYVSPSHLGLSLGAPMGQLSSTGGSRITESTPTTILSSPSSFTSGAAGSTVETLTAAVQSSVASLATPGNLSHLELGNGETLSVSREVVDSIVSAVSGSAATASEGAANAIEPSQPHTDGVLNDVTRSGPGDAPRVIDAPINGGIQGSLESIAPAEIVTDAFTDIVSGIVATPSGIADPSLSVIAADDPIPAPEPATLILFGSGLALAAHQLRRRR